MAVDLIGSVTGQKREEPFFSSANCINKKQKRKQCNICIDLCPEKVFSADPKEALKWDQCKNCGLCVSACPSRCFAPSTKLQNLYTQELDLKHSITISCYKEDTLCDKTVECLGGIPWEVLAIYCMYTEVVLYTGKCAECSHPERIECLKDNLNHLVEFFGEERFAQRVHILSEGTYVRPEEEADTEAERSRGELFSDVKKKIMKSAVKAVYTKLPFLEDVETDGLQYREMLSKVVTRARTNTREAMLRKEPSVNPDAMLPKYGVRLPRMRKECYGCGICSKICPQKAIEFGPEENGKRLVYITPWKCTGCDLCMDVCLYGGAAGVGVVRIPHLERLALVRVESGSCEVCGAPVKPGTTLCNACRLKPLRRK